MNKKRDLTMITDYALPSLLQQLLRSLDDPHSPPCDAVTYAVLSLIARLIASQSAVFSVWYSRRCYERSRGEMIIMLFEKTLSRKVIGNHPASQKSTLGEAQTGDTTHDTEPGRMNTIRPLTKVVASIKTKIKIISKLHPQSRAFQGAKQPASIGKILNLMRQVTPITSKACAKI